MTEDTLIQQPLFLLYDLMTISINEYLMLTQLPGHIPEIEEKKLHIKLIHTVIQIKLTAAISDRGR